MSLGHEPRNITVKIDKEKMKAYANQHDREAGIQAQPNTTVSRLDLSNQSLVEVAKALIFTQGC
jgi:ABC-type sugar transport system ATPase subunit